MLSKKLSLLLLPLTLVLPTACSDDVSEADTETGTGTETDSGDGDGDTGDGDGDGDSAEGDGDGDTMGDGDGDTMGDGDGDTMGDGDGDTMGDGDGDGDTMGDGDGDPGLAMVRFVQGNLTAPPIDIYIDDEMMPAATGLNFQDGTDYVEIASGAHEAKVVQAGDDPSQVVFTYAFNAAADGKYSLAAYDYFFKMLSVTDDDSAIEMGTIRMNLTHIAADVGSVDIYAPGDPLIPLFVDLDFEGTQTIDAPAGGGPALVDINDDMIPDLQFNIPDLGADILVDVYAVNESGGAPVFLLAHLPDGTTARLDSTCGDDLKDDFEVCDGADLDGMTCADMGFSAGTLACAPGCGAFDTSGCFNQSSYCSMAPAAIPDNNVNGVNIDIDVPDDVTILDVDVSVDITHTWLSDLDAFLMYNMTDTPMFSDIVQANNSGCSGNNMLAVLDDEAMMSIENQACVNANVPAVDGTYMPEAPLDAYDGMSSLGTWTFFIRDDAGGDTGTVNEVCILITHD